MSLQELSEAFVGFFTGFRWAYAVEFVLLFFLVYYVFKVLKQNDAGQLIAVYTVVLLSMGTVCLFGVSGAGAAFVFFAVTLLLSFFMLLLFSVEIKRSIWNKKASPLPAAEKSGSARYSPMEADECIEAIIKALQNMSKNAVGALVVLSTGNLPKQELDSGTPLNADISQQLIEGVFFPKAPLHDGAMIIEEHKIRAAGCFLPLTQNNEKYPRELGTRHRAGIGITEVTNVVSLIVSEETGVISIVRQGKITRYADYTMLRAVLKEYYWKDLAITPAKKHAEK